MVELQDLQSAADFFEEFSEKVSLYIEWTKSNWLTIVLTGEIVGAVVAIKACHFILRNLSPSRSIVIFFL